MNGFLFQKIVNLFVFSRVNSIIFIPNWYYYNLICIYYYSPQWEISFDPEDSNGSLKFQLISVMNGKFYEIFAQFFVFSKVK